MSVNVEDFTGSHQASSIASLEIILLTRDTDGYNSFWLSHKNHRYPCLSLLVNGSLATLTYFPKDSHPGFVPVGNRAGLKSGDLTTFRMEKSGEEVQILNDAIVPIDIGSAIAREFFLSEGLPNSIKWNEL